MLCDQINNLTREQCLGWRGDATVNSALFDAFQRLKPAIRRAQKFVLDEAVASAVESVRQGRPSSIQSAIQYCVPPFPVTWIEWAQAPRLFGQRGADLAPGTFATERVGMLVEAFPKTRQAGIIHLFWSFKEPETIQASVLCVIYDFAGELRRLKERVATPETKAIFQQTFGRAWQDHRPADEAILDAIAEKWPGQRKWLRNQTDREALLASVDHASCVPSGIVLPPEAWTEVMRDERLLQGLISEGVGDWDGEVGFLQAAFIMLNCKNAVAQKETLPAPYRDRAIRRAGKQPPLIHRIVTLKLRGPERHAGEQASHASPRAHLVRGHFKTRKSGVFYWSPFVRGDPTLGTVHHDRYEIRP
jgi:hypothetical protein